MKRRTFLCGLTLGTMAAPHAVEAQPPGKMYRIGILWPASSTSLTPFLGALKGRLGELGYVHGKNTVIEPRWADGRIERLPVLATELVSLNVDLIIAPGEAAIWATKKATQTIPIVMAPSGDPVGTGLVASLARPGGNITGVTTQSAELTSKRLELIKETFPKVSRLAVLWNAAAPDKAREWSETELAGRTLGLTLQSFGVRGGGDFDWALAAMADWRPDAFLTFADPLTIAHAARIADFAAKYRLPAIYAHREFVGAGGLMAYGSSLSELISRLATYVDKILKGAKPAALPVEQPTKFELVINLKTAKALGLTIPQSILLRADQVIE